MRQLQLVPRGDRTENPTPRGALPRGVEIIVTDGALAVRAVCECGALAFPVMAVPPRVQLEQARSAATMLLNDTIARCAAGVDLAPGCMEARDSRATPDLRLVT